MRAIYCYATSCSSCGSALEWPGIILKAPRSWLTTPSQELDKNQWILQWNISNNATNTQSSADREKPQCKSEDNFKMKQYIQDTVSWIQMFSYTMPRKSNENGNSYPDHYIINNSPEGHSNEKCNIVVVIF